MSVRSFSSLEESTALARSRGFVFKLQRGAETHRLRVADVQTVTLEALQRLVAATFPGVISEGLVLRFEDSEGDLCVIASDAALWDGVADARDAGRASLRLTVAPGAEGVGTPRASLLGSSVDLLSLTSQNFSQPISEERGAESQSRQNGAAGGAASSADQQPPSPSQVPPAAPVADAFPAASDVPAAPTTAPAPWDVLDGMFRQVRSSRGAMRGDAEQTIAAVLSTLVVAMTFLLDVTNRAVNSPEAAQLFGGVQTAMTALMTEALRALESNATAGDPVAGFVHGLATHFRPMFGPEGPEDATGTEPASESSTDVSVEVPIAAATETSSRVVSEASAPPEDAETTAAENPALRTAAMQEAVPMPREALTRLGASLASLHASTASQSPLPLADSFLCDEAAVTANEAWRLSLLNALSVLQPRKLARAMALLGINIPRGQEVSVDLSTFSDEELCKLQDFLDDAGAFHKSSQSSTRVRRCPRHGNSVEVVYAEAFRTSDPPKSDDAAVESAEATEDEGMTSTLDSSDATPAQADAEADAKPPASEGAIEAKVGTTAREVVNVAPSEESAGEMKSAEAHVVEDWVDLESTQAGEQVQEAASALAGGTIVGASTDAVASAALAAPIGSNTPTHDAVEDRKMPVPEAEGPSPDAPLDSVEQLVSMGFTRADALDAVIAAHGDLVAALNLLVRD